MIVAISFDDRREGLRQPPEASRTRALRYYLPIILRMSFPQEARPRKALSVMADNKKPRSKKKTLRVSARMQALMDGEISIEDLDDEEIFKGQIRADDGTFRGRKPDVIPRKFYDMATQELLRRWQQKVNTQLDPMLKVLQELATSPKVAADARYKSAVYLIERAAGKVPEKSEMKLEVAKWEEDIDGIFFGEDDDK